MTRRLALAVSLAFVLPLSADDKPVPKKGIEGYWLGALKIGAVELRLGFEIKKKDDGTLTATLDSIDQGARDVAIESVAFADGALTLKSPMMKASYTGKLQSDGDEVKGEFEQAGLKLPLDLKRQD